MYIIKMFIIHLYDICILLRLVYMLHQCGNIYNILIISHKNT